MRVILATVPNWTATTTVLLAISETRLSLRWVAVRAPLKVC